MQKERGCIKTKLNTNLAVLTVSLQKNTNFRKSYTTVIQHIKDAENAVFAKICVICVQNTLLRQPPE